MTTQFEIILSERPEIMDYRKPIKWRLMKSVVFLSSLMSFSVLSHAEIDWMSITTDNDVFVGNDNGYSNGLFISTYDVGNLTTGLPTHDFWVLPLMWSMPTDNIKGAFNSYTVGQTMTTASDITIKEPAESELPYSGFLFLTNTYITITSGYADKASTTVGIVGPAALGEETQKFVHKIIGADEPLGWDTQLENELVFQFSRARIWRHKVSQSGNVDLLLHSHISAGTVRSEVAGGMYIRYGRGLISSYATLLFNVTRISNPIAVGDGWYVYGGVQAGYTFNQIFTDGNTFRDSRSIDYDHESVGATVGVAYSWQKYSLTFTMNDSNIIQKSGRDKELENLTQYGSLTLARKY